MRVPDAIPAAQRVVHAIAVRMQDQIAAYDETRPHTVRAVLCRAFANTLMENKDKLDALGVKLVGIVKVPAQGPPPLVHCILARVNSRASIPAS